MNVNEAYELYRKVPSSTTEDSLFISILKYTKRYVSANYGGMHGNWDTFEDVPSAVALRVFQNMDKFKGDAKFSSWLTTIIIRESARLAQEYTTRKGSHLHEGIEDPNSGGINLIDFKVLTDTIRKEIDSKEDMLLFQLKIEGFEDAEIAERIGVTVDSVKSRWKRLKKSLQKPQKI